MLEARSLKSKLEQTNNLVVAILKQITRLQVWLKTGPSFAKVRISVSLSYTGKTQPKQRKLGNNRIPESICIPLSVYVGRLGTEAILLASVDIFNIVILRYIVTRELGSLL